MKQGVTLMGRNTTGPPCIVGRPHAQRPARRPSTRPAADWPAASSVTDDDDRYQPAKQNWPIRRASNKLASSVVVIGVLLSISCQTVWQYSMYSMVQKIAHCPSVSKVCQCILDSNFTCCWPDFQKVYSRWESAENM